MKTLILISAVLAARVRLKRPLQWSLLTLLATLLLCSAPLHGVSPAPTPTPKPTPTPTPASASSTVARSVMVNTNGVVISPTNFWANAPISTNSGATATNVTRASLGLGWSALTNSNAATSLLGFDTNGQVVANTGTNVLTFTNLVSAQALTVAIGTNRYIYADDSIAEFFVPIAMESSQGISFTTNAAVTTRTNLGLPLAALTNTSNVTAMRALGGSTNTNEPYSGTVALTNTNVLTFSNGVLLRIQ